MSVAGKTFRDLRWLALTYMVLLEAMLIPAILMWPELREAMPTIAKTISMPSFMERMMDAVLAKDTSVGFRAYVAIQVFFKGVNVLGIAAAVLFGTGLIARERENQTLEFLLGRPIGRSRLLWGKFWPTALCVVVPVFVTSLSTAWIAPSVEETVDLRELTMASVQSSAFVLLVLTLTVVFSVVSRSQMHTAFAIGAVIVTQLAVFFIQKIRVYSVFMLSDFDVYGPIVAGNVSWSSMLVDHTGWLLGGTIALYVVADRLFARAAP